MKKELVLNFNFEEKIKLKSIENSLKVSKKNVARVKSDQALKNID